MRESVTMYLRRPYRCILPCFWFVFGYAGMSAPARPSAVPGLALIAVNNIDALFGDEIRQAPAKVRWRGEPLTPDTIYALALTGASWELAWGKDHLFSLAHTDIRNSGMRRGRPHVNGNSAVEVVESYRRGDYRHAISVSSSAFSLDEIAAEPELKEAVGTSFMQLGQPERAFAIFAAPYQVRVETKTEKRLLGTPESDRIFREGAFNAARQAGLQKEAVVFAVSLLLEPGSEMAGIHSAALGYLEQSGVNIDRVLLGVLQAPEHLRGLSAYIYAAADLLVLRSSPRLLPIFVQMSESDDVYLRARALLAFGVIAYQHRPDDRDNWAERILPVKLREFGISATERKLISQKLQEAAYSGEFRLRAAAALALGLLGRDDCTPLLQKLAKDRAYLLSPQTSGRDRSRNIRFPVREAASAALARFGVEVDAGSGDLAGRSLDAARRGGQDVTNDRGRLRRDVVSALIVAPTDVLPPLELAERH